MSETIRIKLIHSPIGTTDRIRATVKGLGLRRVGGVREIKRTPAVEGMIKRIPHLVVEVKE
ncbi:MAG TPA: 50S ribosomal protein L30 [Candidatus Binataceae bacterium]|jgi:large subunit ribosomal protein L30